jgi:hypothetical protein
VHASDLSTVICLPIKKNHTIGKLSQFSFRQIYFFKATRMQSLLKVIFASLLACTLIGCSDANRSKIIGTWGIQQADTVMERINEDGPDPTLDPGDFSVNPGPPKMLIRFSWNGQLESSTKMGEIDQGKMGTWEFISYDASSDKMMVLCDIQNQQSEHEITFINPTTIKLVPPNMAGTRTKITFTKQP